MVSTWTSTSTPLRSPTQAHALQIRTSRGVWRWLLPRECDDTDSGPPLVAENVYLPYIISTSPFVTGSQFGMPGLKGKAVATEADGWISAAVLLTSVEIQGERLLS